MTDENGGTPQTISMDEPSTFMMEDIYGWFGDRESRHMFFIDVLFLVAWSIGLWILLCWCCGKCKNCHKHCCRGPSQKKTRTFDTYGITG